MHVVLETTVGDIVLELFPALAPETTAYFVRHLDAGAYDGASFYRSTTLGVPAGPRLIQGGVLGDVLTGSAPRGRASAPELLREIETTGQTGLSHRRGTVSLARDLFGTGFALPEFFLCLGDFPQLDLGGRTEPDDRGFPAFGEVTAGLDRVEQIAQQETGGATPLAHLEGQILTTPVEIQRAFRR
ncbi:MAG: peptidylprolyl isomerase [Myxococcales bacterium]|nr:peptidylprolyl isomerase [Myxococcales bacterium]